MAGDPSLSREQVSAAAPDFKRASAQAAAGAQQAGAGTTPAAPSEGGQQGAAGAASGGDNTAPTAPPATPAENDTPNLNPPALAQEAGDQDELLTKISEAKANLSDRQEAV